MELNGAKSKLAIIGSGPSGQGVLEGTLQQVKAGKMRNLKKIVIYDPSEHTFTGVAYGPQNKLEHHITSDAATFATYENSFSDWLTENQDYVINSILQNYSNTTSKESLKYEISQIKNNSRSAKYFPPRYVIGLYLKAQAERIIDELREAGIEVEIVKKEVISIEPIDQTNNNPKFKIATADNEIMYCEKVASAIGIVPLTYHKPYNVDFHIYEPDSTKKLIDLFQASAHKGFINIHIIGAIASGIDAASTIHEVYKICLERKIIKPNFKVSGFLCSRNGELSHVNISHGDPEQGIPPLDYENKYLTSAKLIKLIEEKKDIISAFAELFQADLKEFCKQEKFPLIEFDLVEYIRQRRIGDNNWERMSELEHHNLKPYRMILITLLNAMATIYQVLETYSGSSEHLTNTKAGFSLAEIHDVIIALTSAIPAKEADRIFNSNPNITFRGIRVEDLGQYMAADVTIDARTVTREGESRLYKSLKANKLIDKNNHSVINGFVQLGYLASARYNTVAHDTGRKAAEYCLCDGAILTKRRFYDGMQEGDKRLKTDAGQVENHRSKL